MAKLLANPAVTGEFQPYVRDGAGRRMREGEPVSGYFPCVVSEADFIKARAARGLRAHAPGPRGEHVTNLFLGLARCTCGATMALQNKGRPPKGARYLTCSDAHRSAGCRNRRLWRLDRVESAVLQALRRVELPRPPEAGVAADSHVAVLEDRLAKALRRRENLLDPVEDGDEGAKERAKALTVSNSALRGETAAAKADLTLAAAMPSSKEQLALLRDLQSRLDSASGDELRDLRSSLAQTLHSAMIRIEFGPSAIVGRMRVEQVRHRVGISQGSLFPDGGPITILDDASKAPTAEEIVGYATEASEDRIRADEEMVGFEWAMMSRGSGL